MSQQFINRGSIATAEVEETYNHWSSVFTQCTTSASQFRKDSAHGSAIIQDSAAMSVMSVEHSTAGLCTWWCQQARWQHQCTSNVWAADIHRWLAPRQETRMSSAQVVIHWWPPIDSAWCAYCYNPVEVDGSVEQMWPTVTAWQVTISPSSTKLREHVASYSLLPTYRISSLTLLHCMPGSKSFKNM